VKVKFEPLARAEFIEAVRWYTAEAGQIYATDFRNEVHRTLSMASDHPNMGAPTNNNTRQLVVHRYPYSIVYRIATGALHVIAVAHHSRLPEYWVGRH
jgi:plasmid stabilization system protein ParE